MANFGAMGQLTGWLPGAGAGAVVGALVALGWWESSADPGCSAPEPVVVLVEAECLDTPLYEFTSLKEIGAAGAFVGGLVGAAVTAYLSSKSKT